MTALLTAISQHILLAYTGFLISAVIGIAGGIVALRFRPVKTALLGFTSLLQAIPAFTLVALMVPFLGIGFVPALAVIVASTVLPVVRNTITGLSSTDPVLIEGATGLGMTWNQILVRVRFPLGIAPIFSGLRLSSIVANAGAIMTVFIGSGGLGTIILEGLVRFHPPGILAGVIPAIGIALTADLMLIFLEKKMTPLQVSSGTK